ncbi:hypothetical protein J4438_02145 [Candidatus Woesearchaeota archaeon]|nr:hypothetical protein [Candidatus Woesearchaeota archaeon]
MKFYIAAKFELKEQVREIYGILHNLGHEITLDWTTHLPIKPYGQNQEIAKKYTAEDIDGIRKADVFILLSKDATGTGTFVELGSAILSNLNNGKPLVYVIGEDTTSMFYFHPSVKRRKNLNEILKELKIIK